MLLTLAMVATATRGAAQVLEIGDDGAVTRYDGPTQFLSTGTRPIVSTATGMGRAPRAASPTPVVAEAIRAASERHQVSERLVEAVAWRESGFNPGAISPKGARGVMQLMPGTAKLLGVDPADTLGNIDGGADYLARMLRRFDGDTVKALAAYNAGPEAVEKYRGVPPYAETIAYVGAILARLGGVPAPATPGVGAPAEGTRF